MFPWFLSEIPQLVMIGNSCLKPFHAETCGLLLAVLFDKPLFFVTITVTTINNLKNIVHLKCIVTNVSNKMTYPPKSVKNLKLVAEAKNLLGEFNIARGNWKAKSSLIKSTLITAPLDSLLLFKVLPAQSHGYHYCTTSFNKAWTQALCRFKSCLRHVRDLWWWGSLTMVPCGNKAVRFSLVNHTTKTIHHHHYYHQVNNRNTRTSSDI